MGKAASTSDRGTNGSTVRLRPVLVSASRRTDIPQFYASWFAERRRAGFAVFRTAFGTPGRASLRPEDVLAYLFWTKYAGPFHPILNELRAEGTPFAFQYTINGYGPTLEPQIPPLHLVLQDIEAVRLRLPSTASLEWRYDPIVLSREWPAAWHLRNFGALTRALQGVVSVVNVSVVEPYVKTVRRMGSVAAEVLYRIRRGAGVRHPEGIEAAGSETARLLGELQGLAAENGIELRVCANPEWALPASRCVSTELFAAWGGAADGIRDLVPRPSRPGCRCLAVVDIGMDNTCIGGCRYCYVTVSDEVARRNHARLDPSQASLR